MRVPATAVLLFFLLAGPLLAEESYFPLAKGNRWELRASNRPDRLVFTVDGVDGDVYEVFYENPWAEVTFFFRPSGDRLYLEAMDGGGGPIPLYESTLFFDFSASADTVWRNALGVFRVLEDQATIRTPTGAFTHCRVIRQVTEQLDEFRWTFAPGVGLVQVSGGGASFKLRRYRLREKP